MSQINPVFPTKKEINDMDIITSACKNLLKNDKVKVLVDKFGKISMTLAGNGGELRVSINIDKV